MIGSWVGGGGADFSARGAAQDRSHPKPRLLEGEYFFCSPVFGGCYLLTLFKKGTAGLLREVLGVVAWDLKS